VNEVIEFSMWAFFSGLGVGLGFFSVSLLYRTGKKAFESMISQ